MALDETLHAAAHAVVDHRLLILALITVSAGLVSGLMGFGFSLIAALGLFLFSPRELFPLFLTLSLVHPGRGRPASRSNT